MTKTGIEYFPQPVAWDEDSLKQLGYKRYSVSIFDHWLTPDEWATNPFVSAQRARASGLELAFNEQSQRFRNFYRIIFEKGVYRLTGLKTKQQVAWHSCWDRRLKKAVTAMVEDRTWGAEFYAPAWRARLISGDDRTDTLLLEQAGDKSAIEMLATRHGLNLIG